MDGIKQQVQARQMEAIENKHTFEKRKVLRENRDEIDKLSDQNKAAKNKKT